MAGCVDTSPGLGSYRRVRGFTCIVPGDAAPIARLSDREIATIVSWVDAGAPMGEPKDMPKAPTFTEGWQLGEPDMIVELPEVQTGVA